MSSASPKLARGLSVLAAISMIVLSGVFVPFSSVGLPLHAQGNAGAVPLQGGNFTSSSSLPSNLTTSTISTSSSTPQISPTSTTRVSSANSTSTSSFSTNSTVSTSTRSTTTTVSNSTTATHPTNSTTSFTRTNSTITLTSSMTITNSTTTHTFTNSTSFTTTTRSVNSTTTSSATNATLIQKVATKWDPYTDFYNFLNYGLFADGGDCYGFSTTSILYFSHYALGDQTDPYYPRSTTELSLLPGQTNTDTLTQVTFPIYIHQHFDPNNLLLNSPNEVANAASLMNSIKGGSPVALLMGPSDGHAIVAWGYSEYSNGNLILNVSDPNFGNVPRTAYYTNGHFSYTGVAGSGAHTWTSFSVASPGPLQWAWLALAGVPLSQTAVVADQTNPYYTYVFSDSPTIIQSSPGLATFNAPGDTQGFNSTISGAVGFEEGSIQVYGVPKGVSYTIIDPGVTESSLVVVVPQNETSIVGYQLSSTSAMPISATISPGANGLSISTTNEINLSLGVFSIGVQSRSVLNSTEIPVSASQRAVLTVPDWSKLNSSATAASVQIFSPTSSQAVTSYTLSNGQPGSHPSSGLPTFVLPAVVIAVVIAVGITLLAYSKRKKPSG